MGKILNLILVLAIIGVFVVAIGGGIAGQAAREYAEAGGQVEARAFTTETYSHAEAGDNSVALAITGDQNGVNLAYAQAQPTPVPDRNAEEARETRAIGGLALVLMAIAVCVVFVAVLLGFV